LFHALVEQLPRRADKRASRDVFPVARLLAHKQDSRATGTFPEDRLGSALPENACAAAAGRPPQLRQRRPLGQERSGRFAGGGPLRHASDISIERAKVTWWAVCGVRLG